MPVLAFDSFDWERLRALYGQPSAAQQAAPAGDRARLLPVPVGAAKLPVPGSVPVRFASPVR